MNNFEMAYLNYLEKDYSIKRLIRNSQKVYDLLTCTDNSINYIDLASNKINLASLYIEQEIFIQKVSKSINVDVGKYNEISLVFEFENSTFKIIYLCDQNIDCAYKEFMSFDPIHEENINTHMFIVGTKITNYRDKFIDFITSIILEQLNIYLKSKGLDISKPMHAEYNEEGMSLRFAIDYFIIIFRTLDGMFDLKFDEWEIIRASLGAYIKIDKLKYVYEFAIASDATEDDYYEMVRRTILEFEYEKEENTNENN